MFKFFFVILFFSIQLPAQEYVPAIVVSPEDADISPLTPYTTTKIENVSAEKFTQPNRQSLADIVKDQVGVETQTYCANCGAKRLTINGLKAEHTSILIDGLPLHSAVSSFYGVESVPVNGIKDIEVMRGAGASLTNPEAIGGTLNLITVDPLTPVHNYSTSMSVNDKFGMSAQNHSALFSTQDDNKKWGLTLGAQFTESKAWDEDENEVAESPNRDNSSVMLKTRFVPNSKNDITFRLGHSNLTILGGPVDAKKPSDVRETPAQETDFEDGNVEKEFTGDPNKITDWISLKRYESAVHWTHYLNQTTTIEWNTGYARQEQQSIYQHGFDYAHNDNLFVTDLSIQSVQKDNHLLKAGLFHKLQRLRSTSEVLFVEKALPEDHFDNTSLATYVNYTYIASEKLEMDLALRVDQVNVNWLELSNEINETVIAPRLQIRQDFSEHLSQRFSYGLGYRAPLTFFESQHGNEENGYEIDIDKLEKAHSMVYSLSFNTPTYYITYGAHYTNLSNMAYGEDLQGKPINYKNTDESYEIIATDLLLGYKPQEWWLLEVSLEYFKYEDKYTAKLPTAAIEERLQLKSSIEWERWKNFITASLVGARDLSRYGSYTNHYVDRNQFPAPETQGDEQKNQNSPAYIVLDLAFSYAFNQTYQLGFGINNLLDETQVKHDDSPSTWHWHFDHGHYDGLHTWGPNRGREIYLKLNVNI